MILGILLGILLPSLHYAIESSHNLGCKNNLRQIGQAFHQYSMDYAGKLPHGDRDSDQGKNYCWFDVLDAYLFTNNLSATKQCPTWGGCNASVNTSDQHSLKMNGGLCPNEHPYENRQDEYQRNWYWPRMWDIPKKSATVLLLDGRMDAPYHTHTDTRIHSGFADVANRHKEGANILLVSGTVIFIPAQTLGISCGEIGWTTTAGLVWEPYKK